uniref:Brevinin-1MT2 n=2 Tax=Amolops TaxID=109940 RepID=BR12_AMOMA|nr:RecName: Full=Brevinins-ALa; AltName: Full=Amolopin-1a; AltName: Full=Brevinins-1E-AL1; Flags: Precursor [Amolops loloensis]E1B241.1 RecName: Full=Brevinin-1MT2; Flags: Precursor [Amolops mantzorum]ABG72906.1 amolopin-1a antimicrobial peptide precursor [Amolops loloensis]ABG72908.1 amolopin-1a antimicrobial peptide precursor [Amolops loloensis]ADM34274.1 brevinin-1MT2 antimicrobial peptide precursor [Amolops mantzorum]
MFTLKKSMLLLFFLGTINLSLCEQERNADEEERRDDDEMDVEVEKRFLPMLAGLAANFLPKLFCKITKKC